MSKKIVLFKLKMVLLWAIWDEEQEEVIHIYSDDPQQRRFKSCDPKDLYDSYKPQMDNINDIVAQEVKDMVVGDWVEREYCRRMEK